MKRGILFLLFICILASSASAMTVTLTSPADEAIIDNTVEVAQVMFQCKVVYVVGNDNITNLSLYTDMSGSWSLVGVNDTGVEPNTDISFTVDVGDTANGTHEWNCLAEDLEGNKVWREPSNYTFNLSEVLPEAPVENTPPSWQQSTNQSTTEDSGTTLIINLDYDSSDTEDDAISQNMTYSISESASNKIDCSISGAEMSCGPPAANQSGDNIITVTATDSGDLTASIDYNISVTAVNDAPYLSTVIPNKTWDQDTNLTIDLDDYFSDIDDSSLTYSYTFTSSTPHNINVTIESDGDAVFTPEIGWTGNEKLTFTAYDAENASAASNEIILTVQEANETVTNNQPNIDTYLPETNPTIPVRDSQTFSITKSDPDGDSMNVTWYVDNVIQEGETGNSFIYTASVTGSFTIKVAISDGYLSDINTWTLTVKSAENKTPTAAPPAEEKTEEKTSICGDGVCDEDEDQFSCCKDCDCPSGYDCNVERNSCTKKKKSGNTILVIIIISLFAGGAAGGVYFYKKSQEKEIFGLTNIPFKAPPKEEEKVKKKEEEKVKKKEFKKPSVATAKKPLKKFKTTNQVLLKKYITYNLRKGKSFEQVKKELLKVGWSEDQIQDAYTAAQLEETFS